MKAHLVFLRDACTLPGGHSLLQSAFCKGWTTAENLNAPALDKSIRALGWHFMWLADANSSRAIGRTAAMATHNAVRRSLTRVSARFNAAEMGRVELTRVWPFWSAKVRVYSRQIQQQTTLQAAC